MQQPNILFIMTDQQRADAMGCSGGWVRTPNLDRIAAEGVRFSNAVTTSPVCVPARISQVTGRYPHNTHVWDNFNHDLPADTPTWWQAIRQAGYRTSMFGKTHLHHHHGDLRDREHLVQAYGIDDIDEIGGPRASTRCLSHLTEGWDKLGLWQIYKEDYAERFRTGNPAKPSPLPLEEYADVYVGQQANKYLADYDRDEPWFCHVSFGGPHEPWDAPEPYASMYDPNDMPPPIDSRETLQQESLNGNIGERLAKVAAAPQRPSHEEIAAKRANYAGNVTLIDDQIGEILKTIEQRGELDNTVIVFSSDHGEMNGDHDMVAKGHFLNGALRVPLLVRTPDTAADKQRKPERVCDSPAEWFDIGPTLVELAGGEMKHQQFAKSLLPVVTDPGREHRRFAVSEISREIMIMDRQWKLIFNRCGEPYLLFDQLNDPGETINYLNAPENKPVVESMQADLFKHLVQTQVDLSGK